MSNQTKGLTFALASAVLYGLIPILGKKIVVDFPPLFVAFAITLLAGFFLGIIGFWKKEILHNLRIKNILWVSILGFFAAIGSIFVFIGLLIGKANEAGFFIQFETFFAAILGFFLLKEKLSYYQVSGLVLMFMGAYIFSALDFLSFKISNIFFLISALVWGINDVIIRKKLRSLSPFFLSFGRNFFSALFLLPLAITYVPQGMAGMSVAEFFYFLLYGCIVAVIILSLYASLKYTKIVMATSFQLLVPIITLIIAFFVFDERLNIGQFIGGFFILMGLFMIIKKSRKRLTE